MKVATIDEIDGMFQIALETDKNLRGVVTFLKTDITAHEKVLLCVFNLSYYQAMPDKKILGFGLSTTKVCFPTYLVITDYKITSTLRNEGSKWIYTDRNGIPPGIGQRVWYMLEQLEDPKITGGQKEGFYLRGIPHHTLVFNREQSELALQTYEILRKAVLEARIRLRNPKVETVNINIVEQLEKLEELHKSQVISDEEFIAAKKRLLP